MVQAALRKATSVLKGSVKTSVDMDDTPQLKAGQQPTVMIFVEYLCVARPKLRYVSHHHYHHHHHLLLLFRRRRRHHHHRRRRRRRLAFFFLKHIIVGLLFIK